MLPRSIAIPKTLKTFDVGSAFSALVYPILGLTLLIVALLLGIFLTGLELKWYYLPLGIGLVLVSIFVCNMGIGPLHRIMQHRAGKLTIPGQILTMMNLIIAMQGCVKDWVNYHSQHHRFADKPGDPHNPAESQKWAWIGWILFRDSNDSRKTYAHLAERSSSSGMDGQVLQFHLGRSTLGRSRHCLLGRLADRWFVTAYRHSSCVFRDWPRNSIPCDSLWDKRARTPENSRLARSFCWVVNWR